jgi:hypothetical protein
MIRHGDPVAGPGDLEDRLRELNTENVVVYGEGRADLPFLGSGQRIKSWKLEIDRKLGAPGPAGGRLDPLPFTDVDLNGYLDSSFVLDQSGTTRAVHRLYIDGRSERLADSTVRMSHPQQSVSSAGLLGEIARTDDDNYRRVYFCLERVARHGEIVVSVFVRPRIADHLLYIELASDATRTPVRFGANLCLHVEELHFNAIEDVVSIGASLQNRLLKTLQDFLEKHQIDTSDFTKTREQIVTTIQTWNVGQVKADMVGFGNNNDFNNRENSAADSPSKTPDKEDKS